MTKNTARWVRKRTVHHDKLKHMTVWRAHPQADYQRGGGAIALSDTTVCLDNPTRTPKRETWLKPDGSEHKATTVHSRGVGRKEREGGGGRKEEG